MQENDSPMENQNDDFTNKSSTDNEYSKWVDNQGDEVTGLPLKTNSVNMSIKNPIIAALPFTSSALLLNPKTFFTSSP